MIFVLVNISYRFKLLGAKQIVKRQDVDMENQQTIDLWMSDVLESLMGINISGTKDYIPQVLDSINELEFNRNNPFISKIMVCILSVCNQRLYKLIADT